MEASNLKPGMYLVKVAIGNEILTQKITIVQ